MPNPQHARRWLYPVAAGALGLLAAACAPNGGTVYDRYASQPNTTTTYYVCAQTAHSVACQPVPREVYQRCPVGAAWPDCRDPH